MRNGFDRESNPEVTGADVILEHCSYQTPLWQDTDNHIADLDINWWMVAMVDWLSSLSQVYAHTIHPG
jgi:hypothetical protein